MTVKRVTVPDEFMGKLSNLGSRTDEIAGKALKAGAGVIFEKVWQGLGEVIGKGTIYDSRTTGELLGSLGISPVKTDGNGVYDVKIGFNEPRRGGKSVKYRSKGGTKVSEYGLTNAMIANILEYGKKSQNQEGKRFMKKALSKANENEAYEAMGTALDGEIAKL